MQKDADIASASFCRPQKAAVSTGNGLVLSHLKHLLCGGRGGFKHMLKMRRFSRPFAKFSQKKCAFFRKNYRLFVGYVV